MSVTRADLELLQCTTCGLIFNSKFDAKLVPYDSNYENTQCCSPAFRKYLENLATQLIEEHHLKGRAVLEVGCGKGDFLKMICAIGESDGQGYDTTYEGPRSFERPNLEFHTQYLTPASVTRPFDLVICRHVIEHVPNIGGFLDALRSIAEAAGDPVVFLETPRFEWIADQQAFWDVFYEHCNYYPEETLRFLCERAGFKVLAHKAQFGGQYQTLELRLARARNETRAPGIKSVADLRNFAAGVAEKRKELIARLKASGCDEGWAIWGAGAKGVALVNQLQIEKPRFVIDSNAAKQGCVIPGSEVPIVAPTDPAVTGVKLILVANPNYFEEIRAELDRVGFKNLAFSA
jgi:hypothetical protein